jgi:hypothetical protein
VTPSVRLAQAVEAYGSMSSFLNPINHVAVPVKWIANHGKPEADGSVQFHVDGYVTKVDKRYPKSGSGKPYWNVQIDDGFDRASITIWGNVWSGGGCSKNAFAMDDNGCRIVEGTDENGKPRYKTCRVDPPSKVVREGKLVRFSVSARNKYGHTIDDSHGACASLLPTSRGWSNEMS